MAPLVRTGGSRHTGLAAPPHRNIHPVNWDDFMEIMDILYPFINADSIQNVFVEFNMLNSEHTEKINIT